MELYPEHSKALRLLKFLGNTKDITSNSTNNNNIAGDFDVDVKLNKQGTLKLKAYSHTERLLKFLSYIKVVPARDIPNTSILREFLGGSSFKY